MPELAEVEYYRTQWNCGIGQTIRRVELHEKARVFRGENLALARELIGAKVLGSEARGKQMLFRFSKRLWLGVHLGMTGKLSVAMGAFAPDKHDHLVLVQKQRSLVFRDPRMFGRVRIGRSAEEPAWWSSLPPAITSRSFTRAYFERFLQRHARLAIKAAILLQSGFAGIGNWMADEILWQARIDPRTLAGELEEAELAAVFTAMKKICRISLATIGSDFSDPPKGWLIHQRWSAKGTCPRDLRQLETGIVGGRTTRWCAFCQKRKRARPPMRHARFRP